MFVPDKAHEEEDQKWMDFPSKPVILGTWFAMGLFSSNVLRHCVFKKEQM